jgi:hypothetical protein
VLFSEFEFILVFFSKCVGNIGNYWHLWKCLISVTAQNGLTVLNKPKYEVLTAVTFDSIKSIKLKVQACGWKSIPVCIVFKGR